jgi:NADH-quinone oxidoreductase subunit C
MSETLNELAALVATRRPDAILGAGVTLGELILTATPAAIADLLGFLRDDRGAEFTTLIDITAIDWPERESRFEVVYHLLSMRQNQRLRVKIAVREDGIVPSVSEVYPAATWFEREVFDMYGVMFSGHPDLRRILTDYGFTGHPLRKDFPTTGYVEVRYDEAEKRVVYEPVKLVQEYRQFDFMSPWEGAEHILPREGKEGAK